MSLKNISFANLAWAGVLTGFFWGIMNLGLEFLLRRNELEGNFLSLILSFATAGALFGALILFLSAWMGYSLDRHPYSTGIKASLIVWFVSVFSGGVMSWLRPDRYHFNLSETLLGGAKVLLLGVMLGWSLKRLKDKILLEQGMN